MAGRDGMDRQVLAEDGSAHLLLQQVVVLLESLVESGEGGSIELAQLPLTEEDYALLDETLGQGEVDARVAAPGPIRVAETGIPGVWWITHLDGNDEVMAAFIEVAFCPEILPSPLQEVAEGLDGLKARLFEAHLSAGATGGR